MRELGLFWRRMGGGLVALNDHLKGGYGEAGSSLLPSNK